MHKDYQYLFIILFLLIAMPLSVLAQVQNQTETTEQDETAAPERVDVAPVADDSQIRDRLVRILTATEWFENPQVEVNDGVVFLSGSTPSMTENSDPLENPIAERINLTLKDEFMDNYKEGYQTIAQAMKEIPLNIAFYNQVRPHSSIERLTPDQAHSKTGPLEENGRIITKKKSYNESTKIRTTHQSLPASSERIVKAICSAGKPIPGGPL